MGMGGAPMIDGGVPGAGRTRRVVMVMVMVRRSVFSRRVGAREGDVVGRLHRWDLWLLEGMRMRILFS